MIIAGLASALAVGIALPSPQVREWPSSGGFDVVQLDDTCAITANFTFDGRAPVELFIYRTSDGARMLLTSRDWSNREGETYSVNYRFDETAFRGEAAGVSDILDKGFVIDFGESFLTAFATSRSMLVSTGEIVITHVNLSGSANAITTLSRCYEHVQSANQAQAARERRWDYISPDPFAPPPRPEPEPDRAGVITNPSWARQPTPDFPAGALARGVDRGRAVVNCAVSPNGSLTDCYIVSEDEAGLGFGEAGLAAATRARLSPRTVDGAQAGSRVTFTIRFEAAGPN